VPAGCGHATRPIAPPLNRPADRVLEPGTRGLVAGCSLLASSDHSACRHRRPQLRLRGENGVDEHRAAPDRPQTASASAISIDRRLHLLLARAPQAPRRPLPLADTTGAFVRAELDRPATLRCLELGWSECSQRLPVDPELDPGSISIPGVDPLHARWSRLDPDVIQETAGATDCGRGVRGSLVWLGGPRSLRSRETMATRKPQAARAGPRTRLGRARRWSRSIQ